MKQLIQLANKQKMEKYKNVPRHAIPKPKYSDKTANGLTKCIIDFLRLSGWQAERINTTGRYLDNSNTYTDSIGRTRVFGSGKWIPTMGQKGSADISATIQGRSVKIEVKMKDNQSEHQKNYQRQIELSGGLYFIAKSWDSFIQWYNENF